MARKGRRRGTEKKLLGRLKEKKATRKVFFLFRYLNWRRCTREFSVLIKIASGQFRGTWNKASSLTRMRPRRLIGDAVDCGHNNAQLANGHRTFTINALDLHKFPINTVKMLYQRMVNVSRWNLLKSIIMIIFSHSTDPGQRSLLQVVTFIAHSNFFLPIRFHRLLIAILK